MLCIAMGRSDKSKEKKADWLSGIVAQKGDARVNGTVRVCLADLVVLGAWADVAGEVSVDFHKLARPEALVPLKLSRRPVEPWILAPSYRAVTEARNAW